MNGENIEIHEFKCLCSILCKKSKQGRLVELNVRKKVCSINEGIMEDVHAFK